LVWIFSKESSDPLLTGIQQVAAQCFLYSPKDRSGIRNWDMETKLADLEGLMASIWPSLANGIVDLYGGTEIRKALALFVSTLLLRHPRRLAETERIHSQMVAAYGSLPKDDVGRPTVGTVGYKGIVRPFDNSTWDEYRKAGPNNIQQMFVDALRQNAINCAEILLKKRWYVVFSSRPAFITTDNPVAVINSKREVFGLATPGTEVLFPLSPTRVLIIDDRSDRPKGLYYPLLDDACCAPFNFLAWQNSDRFMISSRHTDEVCAELLAWSEADGRKHVPGKRTDPDTS
jgi:hypothetical protein